MSTQKEVQHLFNRAGFGLSPLDLQQNAYPTRAAALDFLFDLKKQSGKPVNAFQMPPSKKDLSQEQINANRKEQLKLVRGIGIEWIQKMGSEKANILVERMSLFWHGHFACESKIAHLSAQQLDSIRQHALGNFRDLVMAFAKDPAMLQYLNNQQNRKNKPNENWARELMELFTIGRGNYTENDVKQAARAFTGWSTDKQGNFTFKEKQHDFGEKTFMGKTENLDGTDIIDIILEREETAYFIVKKIYRYFVNENLNEARVQDLAKLFYRENYDIKSLMYTIFSSDWFYDKENIGVKIKSPVELAAMMIRQANLQTTKPKDWFLLQKMLSQVLFAPPNVAGWAGGKSWIDNSTMMTRVNLAGIVYNAQMNITKHPNRKKKRTDFSFDFSKIIELTDGLNKEEIIGKVTSYFLSVPMQINPATMQKFIQSDSHQTYVEHVCVRVMSLPEYQMC